MAWRYTEAGLKVFPEMRGMVFPFHAGEYCGNYHPEHVRTYGIQHSIEGATDPVVRLDEIRRHQDWLDLMREGAPRSTDVIDSDRLEAMGFVGLYLKENLSRPMTDIELVPTPPELMEPAQEIYYNQNGVYGITLS
jgi:hypothetical protein